MKTQKKLSIGSRLLICFMACIVFGSASEPVARAAEAAGNAQREVIFIDQPTEVQTVQSAEVTAKEAIHFPSFLTQNQFARQVVQPAVLDAIDQAYDETFDYEWYDYHQWFLWFIIIVLIIIVMLIIIIKLLQFLKHTTPRQLPPEDITRFELSNTNMMAASFPALVRVDATAVDPYVRLPISVTTNTVILGKPKQIPEAQLMPLADFTPMAKEILGVDTGNYTTNTFGLNGKPVESLSELYMGPGGIITVTNADSATRLLVIQSTTSLPGSGNAVWIDRFKVRVPANREVIFEDLGDSTKQFYRVQVLP